MRRFITLLAAAVGLLLLVGALSVGMLLLVRTEARRDEFAMCLAMGASRTRLACGVSLEGLLLALSGAVLALPISAWMHSSVSAFNLPGNVSLDLLDQSLDVRVVAAAAVAGLAAAVVIAIVAGAFSFSARVADALRARGSTPRLVRRRTRSILVIVQTAVAVVLVAGAGLLARSLVEALRLNPGYDTTQLITTHVDPAPSGYDRVRAGTLFEELRTRLLQRPSVRNVAFVRFGSGMGAGGNLRIDGTPRAVPSMTEFRVVDERYFATLGLRVRHGRDFGKTSQARRSSASLASRSGGSWPMAETRSAALGALAMLLTVLGTAVLAESLAALRRREMGSVPRSARQAGSSDRSCSSRPCGSRAAASFWAWR
jgi:cell division protein FtsX